MELYHSCLIAETYHEQPTSFLPRLLWPGTARRPASLVPATMPRPDDYDTLALNFSTRRKLAIMDEVARCPHCGAIIREIRLLRETVARLRGTSRVTST
jgi:hypothetical protein